MRFYFDESCGAPLELSREGEWKQLAQALWEGPPPPQIYTGKDHWWGLKGGRWRMRVGGPFLDSWHSALNELLVLRDGEAVRQMEREDSSVERGSANTLLCFFCSVISSAKGRGMCPAFRRGTGGCPLSRPCPGGAPPTRFAGALSCQMKDCGRMGRGTAVPPPDKPALATGVAAWGPCWRAGAWPTASAVPSLRLWGRRCNLSSYGRPVLLVGAKGRRAEMAPFCTAPNPDRSGRGSWLPGGGGMAGRKKRAV